MGAFHAGHLSLIKRACQENRVVVVTIFVNPLQFGPQEDLATYPRDLLQDQAYCQELGVDVVFAPEAEAFYGLSPIPPGPSLWLTQVVPPVAMTEVLCGRSRPGHFQGVVTVVTKLLNLIQPTRTYFGQKDGQQVAIIRSLVRDLNLPGEVVVCPTVREDTGLACSSRNRYLSPSQHQQAQALYQGLEQVRRLFNQGERQVAPLLQALRSYGQEFPDLEWDYGEIVEPDTLVPLAQIDDRALVALAAYVGDTRLIDNCLLLNRKPILAIDGPAGAGKSTVTRRVAQQLGLLYLDTGAMYRAVTWLLLELGIALDNEPAVAEVVSQARIQLGHYEPNTSAPNATSPILTPVWVNGQAVTEEIRDARVTAKVSQVAAQPMVRACLVQQQQQYGRQGGIVAEGRDMGTAVFPDAELKIFLTASIAERARRRYKDLHQRGPVTMTLDQLTEQIADRDRQDSSRAISPLIQAEDAIEVLTDGMTIEAVIERIIELYRQRCLGG
jgi:pantoate ligase/cytidylate kinase